MKYPRCARVFGAQPTEVSVPNCRGGVSVVGTLVRLNLIHPLHSSIVVGPLGRVGGPGFHLVQRPARRCAEHPRPGKRLGPPDDAAEQRQGPSLCHRPPVFAVDRRPGGRRPRAGVSGRALPPHRPPGAVGLSPRPGRQRCGGRGPCRGEGRPRMAGDGRADAGCPRAALESTCTGGQRVLAVGAGGAAWHAPGCRGRVVWNVVALLAIASVGLAFGQCMRVRFASIIATTLVALGSLWMASPGTPTLPWSPLGAGVWLLHAAQHTTDVASLPAGWPGYFLAGLIAPGGIILQHQREGSW